MIDQPVAYTTREGGQRIPFPSQCFEVSNPFIMIHRKASNRITVHGASTSAIRGRFPGAWLSVHSLHWQDGARWDAQNGVTVGEFPR